MIHFCQGYLLTDARHASMFRDRKALFVDPLGWDVPVADDQYEIDRYDADDALYLRRWPTYGIDAAAADGRAGTYNYHWCWAFPVVRVGGAPFWPRPAGRRAPPTSTPGFGRRQGNRPYARRATAARGDIPVTAEDRACTRSGVA